MNNMIALSHDTGRVIHDRIKDLLPEIAARADEIESNSAVPLDLLDKIEAAGGFRMAVPAAFGGAEMSLRETCAVVEMVAAVDASVAWTMAVTIGTQVLTSHLPHASLTEFYSTGPDTWAKAAFTPKVVAIPVEGGYKLSGRWPLASGARRFNWAGLGFMVKDGKDIRMMPDGMRPDIRVCLIPAGPVKVIETWKATGLRGTRSDDLEITDVFVPEAWQGPFFGPSNLDGPVVRATIPSATVPVHSAVMIGILKGAVADLAEVSLTRRAAFNPAVVMKDDPVFLGRFGELAARVNAMQALQINAIELMSRTLGERRLLSMVEECAIVAEGTLINHDSTKLMDDIMMLSGSGAVYDSNIQQRRWRDLRCAAQHQSVNIGNFGRYGTALVLAAAHKNTTQRDKSIAA